MKILEAPQGSPEWEMGRVGKATASNFHRVMTEKRRGYSQSAESGAYLQGLIFERLTGQPVDTGDNEWMERGRSLEEKAVAWYEQDQGVDVRRVGLCVRDDGKVGASPDGLVGTAGKIEVKCFGAIHHIGCLIRELPARMTQVQGGLWITEREWCDVVAWNPAMTHLPPVVVRVWRDEGYIEDLARCVNRLVASVDEHVERIQAYGIRGRREEIRPVTLIEALEGSLPFEGGA
jgi:hypothetical protein